MKPTSEEALKAMYSEYLADFDPTPNYYGEDYYSPQSYDSWVEDYLDQPETPSEFVDGYDDTQLAVI